MDVLATFSTPQPRSRAVLQDVRVVATECSLLPTAEAQDEVSVVTLLVTTEQAETLALASAQGWIHLALRNGAHRAFPHTPGAELGRLVQERAPSAPRRPSRPPNRGAGHVIEIYNGNERSVASF